MEEADGETMKTRIAGREVELDIEERLERPVGGGGVGTRTARTAQATEQAGAPAPSPFIIYGKPIGKPSCILTRAIDEMAAT